MESQYTLGLRLLAAFAEEDCIGPGWQHYAREDGKPFASMANCTIYYRGRRR
jgi:hypothetical protein